MFNMLVPAHNESRLTNPHYRCPVCQYEYDCGLRSPRTLECSGSHVLCYNCLTSRIALNKTCVCPICHEQVTIDSADKANLNREIIKTLENHAESLNLMMSAVYCNECKLLTSEESLRICNTCSAKKDSKLDISSENFDDTQLENLAVCTGCILNRHNDGNHVYTKFRELRMKRNAKTFPSLWTNTRNSFSSLDSSFESVQRLINNFTRMMHDLSNDAVLCETTYMQLNIRNEILQENHRVFDTTGELLKHLLAYRKDMELIIHRLTMRRQNYAPLCKAKADNKPEMTTVTRVSPKWKLISTGAHQINCLVSFVILLVFKLLKSIFRKSD